MLTVTRQDCNTGESRRSEEDGIIFLSCLSDDRFKSLANTLETLHFLLEVCRLLPSDHEDMSPHTEKSLHNPQSRGLPYSLLYRKKLQKLGKRQDCHEEEKVAIYWYNTKLLSFYLFSPTFQTLPFASSLSLSNIFRGKVSLLSIPPSECGNFYKAIWVFIIH